ncbi:MAG: UvrD-helicase domain-containing protein, partial [Anaerolineales bacterium]
MEQNRKKHLESILASDSSHKLIISGPGTGKTFTFGKVLENDPGNSLVITLLNNLVDDMQRDLGELADVRTFHSLSRMLLHQRPFGGITSGFHFFPQLPDVIAGDSMALAEGGLIGNGFGRDEFGKAFRLLSEDDRHVELYIDRANYYNTVGFDDSVYRLLMLFQSHPEAVPRYHYVMVDEYQDYNELEGGVIAALESANRMLIVGDDDQAIYEFRQASPAHLRDKARDESYVRFPLPYCTRCTQVIVSAVDSVVESAQVHGFLGDRLNKEFVCYLPDKQADSEKCPTIQIAICSVHRKNAPYIARYIETVVSNIEPSEIALANEGDYPLALIVGPGHYLDQIYEYLRAKFENVAYRPSSSLRISVLDGFKLLRESEDSNLAWRILTEQLHSDSLEDVITGSADNRTPMVDLLDVDFRDQQLDRLRAINQAIVDIELLSRDEVLDLESSIGQPIDEIMNMLLQRNLASVDDSDQEEPDAEPPKPTLLLTNFNGCKGLSAGFTFVTGLEERIFPRDNRAPSDTEICQFIVALTRTRKQCHLIHTRNFAGSWT